MSILGLFSKKKKAANVVIDWLDGQCPVQAEGKFDDEPFFFRARGERWYIEVGTREPRWIHSEPYGDSKYAAGWMTHTEARELIDRAAVIWYSKKTRR